MAAGGSALLVLIGGGTAGVAAFTEDEPRIVTAVDQASSAGAAALPQLPAAVVPRPPAADAGLGTLPRPDLAAAERTSDEADRTGTRAPRSASTGIKPTPGRVAAGTGPEPAPPAAPVVTTRITTETRTVPFQTRLIRDPEMPRGTKRVEAPGVPGEETLRYRITYTDGRPTDRRLVGTEISRQPQDRVVAFGTRRATGDRDCRHDACWPGGRSATCPEPAEAATESGAAAVAGSVPVLDQDLYTLDAQDLSGLDLDPAMIC
jgi:hypothetical protein